MAKHKDAIKKLANRVKAVYKIDRQGLERALTAKEKKLLAEDQIMDAEYNKIVQKVSRFEKQLNISPAAPIGGGSTRITSAAVVAEEEAVAVAAEAGVAAAIAEAEAAAVAAEAAVAEAAEAAEAAEGAEALAAAIAEAEAAAIAAEVAAAKVAEAAAAEAEENQFTANEGGRGSSTRPVPESQNSNHTTADETQSQAQDWDWLKNITDPVKGLASNVSEGLGQLATMIGKVFSALWDAISGIFASIFNGFWGNSATPTAVPSASSGAEKSEQLGKGRCSKQRLAEHKRKKQARRKAQATATKESHSAKANRGGGR